MTKKQCLNCFLSKLEHLTFVKQSRFRIVVRIQRIYKSRNRIRIRQNEHTDSMRIRILAANLDSKHVAGSLLFTAFHIWTSKYCQLTLDEAGSKGRGGWVSK
jgi:hypothetical protein